MDQKTFDTPEMMEHVNKYVKNIISKPIQYVDEINLNSIMSVKQRLNPKIKPKK